MSGSFRQRGCKVLLAKNAVHVEQNGITDLTSSILQQEKENKKKRRGFVLKQKQRPKLNGYSTNYRKEFTLKKKT